MSDTLNDRTSRAFEKIKGWNSLSELNQVNDFVDVSRATKKRTIVENFDSWLAIKHPRITFMTLILLVVDIAINLSK